MALFFLPSTRTVHPVSFVRNSENGPTQSCSTSGTSTLSWPYVIEGLPPGQYYLLARDGPFGAFGGDFVDVLYGDIVCITEDCDVRRGLAVTVTSGSTTTGVDFTARRGARSGWLASLVPLSVYDARGVELVDVVRWATDTIFHTSISYEIVGLPPGTYYVRYVDLLSGGLSCVDCAPTAGRPILVRPGDRFVDFAFGPGPSRVNVSGTVRDSGGVPLTTITVELRAGSVLFGRAVTDDSGRYTITSVAPGTYFLRTRRGTWTRSMRTSRAQHPTCDAARPWSSAPPM
jgi:Carboxypeptidase regulatory-like domain